jgi:hypothetical protein
MTTGSSHTEQARLLQGFITANTVIDRVEIAHTIIGVDVGVIDPAETHFPLVWLALGYIGDELHGVGSGFCALDAIGNLCTKLLGGEPCPNCRKAGVFYDGLSPRWTYDSRVDEPWSEFACPIFFDHDLGCWHRACMKQGDDVWLG